MEKLMNDSKARDIYLAIPATMPPADIADKYLVHKLAGDKSACLAYETHARQLAQIHFTRGDVLAMLNKIERYKAMRKPGTGGESMLKHIADQIEWLYSEGLFIELDDGRIEFTVFTGGKPGQKTARPHMLIKCENRPGAVAWVVAKYRRGLSKKAGAARYGTNWRYAK